MRRRRKDSRLFKFPLIDDGQVGAPVGGDCSYHIQAKNNTFVARSSVWGISSTGQVVAGAAATHNPGPSPQFGGPLYLFYAVGVGGTGGTGTDTMSIIPKYRSWVMR